jgi:hypothetical protein
VGGGIYQIRGNQDHGVLTVKNCTLSANHAAQDGGGIENDSSATIIGSTFIDNDVGGAGGGVWNRGTMAVSGCTFSSNSAVQGGGIFNSGGTLTVKNSTLSDNLSGAGGGIFNNGGTATVTSSTLSGNHAGTFLVGVSGGAIENDSATLTIINSTLYGNFADSDSRPGNGGAINTSNGIVTLYNSTLSGNAATHGGGMRIGGTVITRDTIVAGDSSPFSPDIEGNLASQGHNLIGDGTGGSGFTNTDLVGTSGNPIDPMLGPLQNNGGRTDTMALLVGSPAIGAGDTTDAPKWDQRGRGFPRIVDDMIDIGAYEVQDLSSPFIDTNTNFSQFPPAAEVELTGPNAPSGLNSVFVDQSPEALLSPPVMATIPESFAPPTGIGDLSPLRDGPAPNGTLTSNSQPTIMAADDLLAMAGGDPLAAIP